MFGPIFNLICDEARKVWCFRWLMLVTSATIFVVAAGVIFALPSAYEASGQIFVRKETPLSAAAEGVSFAGDNIGNPLLIQKTMLNDANVKKVVRRAYPNAGTMSASEMDDAIATVRRAQIKPDGDDGFIDFSLKDSDPVRAQKLTSALLHQYVFENVNRSSQDITQASNFLDSQIASYQKQLTDLQGQIDAFRRQHPHVAVMTPLAPVVASAGGGGADVAGARAELAAVMSRNSGPAAVSAPQDGALAQAQQRLAGMLTQYTEQHPDVISTRREIAALKAQRAQYLASLPPQPTAVDPAVAAARQRLAFAQSRVRQSAAPATAAPDLSADWAELRRRNDTLTENYQRLISRREGAKVSQAIYGSEDSGKYQVTREPTVPAAPSGPNRGIFLAAAAFLALGAGLAAAYLRAGIAGIFVSPRELEDAFQLPVIGTVSWEPAWHVKKTTRRTTPALPAR